MKTTTNFLKIWIFRIRKSIVFMANTIEQKLDLVIFFHFRYHKHFTSDVFPNTLYNNKTVKTTLDVPVGMIVAHASLAEPSDT